MSYYSPEEFELLRLTRVLGGTSKVHELLKVMKNNDITVGALLVYLKSIEYKIPSSLDNRIAELERRISTLEGKPQLSKAESKPPKVEYPKKGEITPQDEYGLPILESLIEMGGSGRMKNVLNRVLGKMKNKLKPKDYDKLSSGTEIRWKNAAAWERNKLKVEGHLKKDSPRGIWEITEEGRKFYEILKEKQ